MHEPYLIVGLGNPSPRYTGTRHNAGRRIVNVLASELVPELRPQQSPRPTWRERHVHRGYFPDCGVARPVVLVTSLGNMNSSGAALAPVGDEFEIPPRRIIVVHDDMELEPGEIRVKVGGSARGHNGLKSITAALATDAYLRVRFGIGRPNPPDRVARHVVGAATLADFAEVKAAAQITRRLIHEPVAAIQADLDSAKPAARARNSRC